MVPHSAFKRLWQWLAILWLILCLYPVEYRTNRIVETVGVVVVWAGALLLWWKLRYVRFTLIALAGVLMLVVSLPRRAVDQESLAAGYCRELRLYRGVRYVWGGEGFLGIDCSGLMRKGLIWGQTAQGLRTLNGGLIRDAVRLWWNDCPAKGLIDGRRVPTRVLFEAPSTIAADHQKLKPGDLAVTQGGVHVMAYLGDHVWIEADPTVGKVIEVPLPTTNEWFAVPVVFVRWRCLEPITATAVYGMRSPLTWAQSAPPVSESRRRALCSLCFSAPRAWPLGWARKLSGRRQESEKLANAAKPRTGYFVSLSPELALLGLENAIETNCFESRTGVGDLSDVCCAGHVVCQGGP